MVSSASSPTPHRRARPPLPWRWSRWLPALLLGAALSVAGVLAWQAVGADRSHRSVAERTLGDYASFAAWELNQEGSRELLAALVGTFVSVQIAIDPDRPNAWPTPVELRRTIEQRRTRAPFLDSARFFFRVAWSDSAISTAGSAPTAAVSRWVRDTVLAYPRIFTDSAAFRPIVYGGSNPKSTRLLKVLFSNDQYVAAFTKREGRERVAAYGVSRGFDGAPLVAYGFEEDARHFVEPVLARVLRETSLLPPSLMRNTPLDSVLAVRVTTADGTLVFDTHNSFTPDFDGPFARTQGLDARFGGLQLRVAMNPEFAPRLVVGGLPRSRLPLILTLLLLSASLVGIALWQLRRQQELSRLRADFVAGVSHELRTPLAQIRLFAELMRGGTLQTESDRERSAHIIDEEAQRLTVLIENVLAFARSERGAPDLRVVPIDLAAEIRGAVESFAPLARSRRAQVRADVVGPLAACADPRALRQVLLNLLDNAVKYAPQGRAVVVGAAPAGDHVRLWVDDEGPGVPASARDRVWEPYVRLDRKEDAAVGGSGIGLSVVRDLVSRQGGSAWFEQAPGGGARVIVELQAASGTMGVESDGAMHDASRRELAPMAHGTTR